MRAGSEVGAGEVGASDAAGGMETKLLAERITGCAHTVSNALGSGFLEEVYENAPDNTHLAQCRNPLKATGLWVCLLLNVGTSRVPVKRIVL